MQMTSLAVELCAYSVAIALICRSSLPSSALCFVYVSMVWGVILHLVNVIDHIPSQLLHIPELTLEVTDWSPVSCVAETATPIQLGIFSRLSNLELRVKLTGERIVSQSDFKFLIACRLTSQANHDQQIWETFSDVLSTENLI